MSTKATKKTTKIKKRRYDAMAPKVKETWVTALRSGKYKQCTGTLVDNTRHYCCLGVLNVAMGKRQTYSNVGKNISSQAMNKLIKLNDGEPNARDKRKSFKYIATWIEKNL